MNILLQLCLGLIGLVVLFKLAGVPLVRLWKTFTAPVRWITCGCGCLSSACGLIGFLPILVFLILPRIELPVGIPGLGSLNIDLAQGPIGGVVMSVVDSITSQRVCVIQTTDSSIRVRNAPVIDENNIKYRLGNGRVLIATGQDFSQPGPAWWTLVDGGYIRSDYTRVLRCVN